MEKSIKTHVYLAICTVLFLSVFLIAGSSSSVSAGSQSFGYAQIGNSSNSTFGGLLISNFTSPGNVGGITRVEVYMATGGGIVQAVIYSDANGAPVSLIASSETVNVEATNGSWVSFNVNYTALPKFTYWIGVVFQNAATYYYSSGMNETAVYSASSSVASTVCPSGTATTGNVLSVYAVYTPASNGNQSNPWLLTVLISIAIIGIVLAIILAVVYALRKSQKES